MEILAGKKSLIKKLSAWSPIAIGRCPNNPPATFVAAGKFDEDDEVHIEIHVSKDMVPAKGIRLASGYMQRSVRKGGVLFYKPLTVQDGLSDLNGNLKPEEIIKLINTIIKKGTLTFSIYEDNGDPSLKKVELDKSDLSGVVFLPNITYQITKRDA